MVRQIIVPTSNVITFTIPADMVGKSVEMIAFEVPETKTGVFKKILTPKEKEEIFDEMCGAFPDFPSQEEIRSAVWKTPQQTGW